MIQARRMDPSLALNTVEKRMSRTAVDASCVQVAPIIVADVGGTYARLGWVDSHSGGSPVIHDFQRYACAEHSSLASILRRYADERALDPAIPPLKTAVVAIAGLLEDDRLLNANLSWPVSLAATRNEAGLDRLELINDFAAVAYAIPHVDPVTLVSLNAGGIHSPRWPALVLGPGTGLGAALSMGPGQQRVLPSEAGHSALAAGTNLEIEILRLLMQRFGYVNNERVLSGPGLVNLYSCLCELKAEPMRWRSPDELIDAAQQHGDALALLSIQVFCEWLGSVIGDLVITFGARSVYLTGGITGHLAAYLHDGRFLQRYLNKGALSTTVQQVPVWRIDHGQLGALGAAAWFAHAPDCADAECRNLPEAG